VLEVVNLIISAADATVPAIYNQSFQLVDTNNTGEVSVTSLSRVLGTSSLPAATIDKVSTHM
jgi:sorting nexin-8